MFFINPFIYGGPAGDFESIATVTVGSGGASSIEFTSIPGTFQHLQIRFVARTNRATARDYWRLTVNSDTGSNYAYHGLAGTGSATEATAQSSQTVWTSSWGNMTAANATASIFGAGIVDILDYGSTSKTKTVRVLTGQDSNNTDGLLSLNSGLWNSTSAITTLKLAPGGGSNFAEHSTAALYGIKAP